MAEFFLAVLGGLMVGFSVGWSNGRKSIVNSIELQGSFVHNDRVYLAVSDEHLDDEGLR